VSITRRGYGHRAGRPGGRGRGGPIRLDVSFQRPIALPPSLVGG